MLAPWLDASAVPFGAECRPDSAFVPEVTPKPLISLVWGGFYVMMFGGILAMLERAKYARQAAIA